MLADEDRVADLERSACDEKRCARAKPLLQLGLDDVAVGTAVGVRLEFKDFGLDKDVFEEGVDAQSRDAGNGYGDNVAAPVFRGEAALL